MKSQVNHAEGIEGCEQYGGNQQAEHHLCYPAIQQIASQEGSQQNFVLAPEPGEWRDSHQAQRADKRDCVGPRHLPPQPTHIAHVEGPNGMVDTTGCQKQQRFEESMGEQMK